MLVLLAVLSCSAGFCEISCSEIREPGASPVLYIQGPAGNFVCFNIFVPNRSLPVSGTAHMVEHLIFGSAEGLPSGALDLALESLGYSADAYTSCDFTCFRTVIRPEHLDTVCSLFAQALRHPLFDENELRLEKGIVKDEYAGRDGSFDALKRSLLKTLYGNTLYGLPPEGENVDAITVDDLRLYHELNYKSVVLVVYGSVDRDALAAAALKYFPAPRAPLSEQVPDLKPRKGVSELTEGGLYGIGVPMAPAGLFGESVSCSVLSSLVYNAVREGLPGARVRYSHNTGKYASPFLLMTDSPQGKEVIAKALEDVRAGRYTDGALDAAKRLQLTDFLTRNQEGKSLTYQLGQMYLLNGLKGIGDYQDFISGVSREDIAKAAEKYL